MVSIKDHFKDTFEPELLEELGKVGIIQNISAGDTLLGVGETVRLIPILINGIIKVSRIDSDGKELLLYYVNPLESCVMTFTCCMQHRASEIQAVAEDDTTFIGVPVQYMDLWMDKFSTWKSFVMQSIQHRFNELLDTIDQITFQKLDERLIRYLKEKSKVTDSTLINLSHEQIARELATSRVVISRLLKQLEHEGRILLYRNQIKILRTL